MFEGFKEDEHPRGGKGTKEGGKFVPKGVSGTATEEKDKSEDKESKAKEKGRKTKTTTDQDVKKWKSALSERESTAILEWQYGGYEEIRKAQIGNGTPQGNKLAAIFESALDKDGQFEGIVYRGIHDLTDEQITTITSSKEISFDALASASKDEEVTHHFLMSEVPIGVPDKGKSVLFKIQTKTGVDLEPVSSGSFAREKEVVIRKGTKYEILGSKKRIIHQKIKGYASWDQEIIEVMLSEK